MATSSSAPPSSPLPSTRSTGGAPERRVGAIVLTTLILPGVGHFLVARFREGLYLLLLSSVLGGLGALCVLRPGAWLFAGAALMGLGAVALRVIGILHLLRLPAERIGRPAQGPLLLALAAALCLGGLSALVPRTVAEALNVPTGSMSPTVLSGDRVTVDRLAYGLRLPLGGYLTGPRAPRRGDVVVLRSPRNPAQRVIKRVVATGGDTIETRQGELVLNGKPVPRSFQNGVCEYEGLDAGSGAWQLRTCYAFREMLDGRPYSVVFDPRPNPLRTFKPTQVPPGHVFVLGDNRDNSQDSRDYGPVPLELVEGRLASIWWSRGRELRWQRVGQAIE